MLLGLFVICVFASQEVALIRYLTDTPGISCPTVITQYGKDLQVMAFIEWKEQRDRLLFDIREMDLNSDVSRTGTYSCFCYN